MLAKILSTVRKKFNKISSSDTPISQENIIIHIKHTSGKFPEKIKSLLEDETIFKSPNISLIIESSIEKRYR